MTKSTRRFPAIFAVLLTIFCLFNAPLANVFAATRQTQPNIIAKINFNPKIHGFGFRNYTNKNHHWQDDLGAGDMIRLFGAGAVCQSGNTPQNCVLKAAAREWMMQKLEAMDGGHCEGMAVASLRFATGKEFKSKIKAADFQPAAQNTFGLKLTQPIENYIAYYWLTQTLQEVYGDREKSRKTTPVAVVNELIKGLNGGRDTFPIAFWKMTDGKLKPGHAVTPFAVEDAGTYFSIHVYDNNYPGQTRYIIVEKAGKQNWKYVTAANPNEPASSYAGNIDTKSLAIAPTSLRDKPCFKSPFSTDGKGAACVPTKLPPEKPAAAQPKKPVVPPAPARPKKPAAPKIPQGAQNEADYDESADYDGELAEFALNGNAEMMVIDSAGYALGTDPQTGYFVDEIPFSDVEFSFGGLGGASPLYRIPFQTSSEPYTVIISGRGLAKEENIDLTYSAPGLTVGFDGIRVDAGELLALTITPDGEQISFTASTDGETPEIYFAFDGANGGSKIELDGGRLQSGKTLTAEYDDETGRFYFYDTDGDDDNYDVDFVRYNADGSEIDFETDNLGAGSTADRFEMNFAGYVGEDAIEVKTDDEGDGFDDDEPEEALFEDNDGDPDDADDEGDDEDSDADNDGQLNNADADDDNDGLPDAKDSDDDDDGLSDSEDADTTDDDGDGKSDDEDTDDDGDGVTDDKDTDDDNDGTTDEEEDGEFDTEGTDEIADDEDDDNDGIPDAKDSDDDNDGISDSEDEDTDDDDGDGTPDDEDADDDGDGTPDDKDTDDDNDGESDEEEDNDDGEPDDGDDDGSVNFLTRLFAW